MGTDIEVHTELKINGIWHHFGCPHIERKYQLFAKMADVRNCGPNGESETPLAFVKTKVPMVHDATIHESMSPLTQYFLALNRREYFYTLNLVEIKKLVTWFEKEFDPMSPWGLEGLFDFVDHNGWASLPNKKGIEDARFIFWFH